MWTGSSVRRREKRMRKIPKNIDEITYKWIFLIDNIFSCFLQSLSILSLSPCSTSFSVHVIKSILYDFLASKFIFSALSSLQNSSRQWKHLALTGRRALREKKRKVVKDLHHHRRRLSNFVTSADINVIFSIIRIHIIMSGGNIQYKKRKVGKMFLKFLFSHPHTTFWVWNFWFPLLSSPLAAAVNDTIITRRTCWGG